MKFKRTAGTVACERLKCVMETDHFECAGGNMAQMKKEILEIIGRYYDLSPESYDIKIVLKSKKRAAND